MNDGKPVILGEQVLSDNWYILKKITFKRQLRNGDWTTQSREAYDRGNGSTVLLYSTTNRTVLLTRQFRLPTYVNGNPSGMLIEACAGLLDADDPDTAIRREAQEETGIRPGPIQKVFAAYMSPGSVTEILHFYTADVDLAESRTEGGGIDDEDIEVLEIPFEKALSMIQTGEIQDGKTILLLYHLRIHAIL